jgi:carboxypeptidase C (cathepsin A)
MSVSAPPTSSPAPAAPSAPAHARRQREAVEQALAESPSRSTGQITLAGRPHPYRVEAGFLPVRNAELGEGLDEVQAAVFTTAYLLDGARPAERPVCFAFNGGPGSSSIVLQFGALGPKRVRIRDDGGMPTPPWAVQDNPLSWFEHFDLVFIDPPHTGYSISASDEARKKLLSVDGDVAALCEVMAHWLTRHQRWASPVYLCGESYGTTRAAAMADRLCEQGLGLAGLILVSCAMDIQALEFTPRNDLPYSVFLPAYAGAAQYHGLLKGPLAASGDAARAAAQDFVFTDYLAALHRGTSLDERERRRIARRLSELTGLPPHTVEQMQLRISDTAFFSEALRERGQQLGRLDARVTAPMASSHTRASGFDASMDALVVPYTMAAMQFHHEVLGFGPERRHVTFSSEVNKQWNWSRGQQQGNSFTCTSPDLSRAMRRLPHLRLFVASGLYDLATPVSATEWSLAQLDLPPALRARITHHHYQAGHMMYTREADLARMKADLAAWLVAPRER